MSIDHIEEVSKSVVDSVEHVEKFNPYHDSRGRFSAANGAASFTYAPGKSKAHDMAIAREKERQAAAAGAGAGKEQSGVDNKAKAEETYNGFKKIVAEGSGDPSNISTKKAAKVLDEMPEGATITMRHQNQWHEQKTEYTSKGSGKWNEKFVVNGKEEWSTEKSSYGVASNIMEEIGGGSSVGSLSFSSSGVKAAQPKQTKQKTTPKQPKQKQPEVFDMVGYLSQGMTINSKGEVVPSKKSIDAGDDKIMQKGAANMKTDHIIEVNKGIDNIEEVQKANPYHDSKGRFTTASGASGGGTTAAAAGTVGGGAINAKLGDMIDWRGQPYILISDSGGKNGAIKLRPVSRYGGDSDFDGGGDSFEDVHLDRSQLSGAEIIPPYY